MSRSLRSVLPWVLGGCLLGIVWFFYNYSLPPLYKGRNCCDSVQYIGIAQSAPGLKEILDHTGERTLGYPLFLWLHKSFVHLVAAAGSDWVPLSLVSCLVLHFVAILFLYWVLVVRLKTKLSPVFLLLTLAHPGLVSHAALPLTDSITASLCTAALGFAIWGYEEGLRTRTKVLVHLAAGALLGACVLIRPSFLLLAAAALPTLWFVLPAIQNARRDAQKTAKARVRAVAFAVGHYLLPVVIGIVLVSAVGFRNCMARYQTFCVSNPAFNANSLSGSIKWGLTSPRVYTAWMPRTRSAFINDPYSLKRLGGARCAIAPDKAFGDLGRCYAKHWRYVPVHLVKKTIGLFDNFHLNTYATDITRPWHSLLNRTFGCLAFLGWLSSFYFFYSLFRDKRFDEPHLIALSGFVVLYVGIFINLHIESRYGFPAIVPCLVMLGHVTKTASKRAKCALLAGALLFWIQTVAWDAAKDVSLGG